MPIRYEIVQFSPLPNESVALPNVRPLEHCSSGIVVSENGSILVIGYFSRDRWTLVFVQTHFPALQFFLPYLLQAEDVFGARLTVRRFKNGNTVIARLLAF